ANGKALAIAAGTLWHTADGGQNWNPLVIPGGAFQARTVAYSLTQTNVAYVVEGGGADPRAPHRVARSSDGGANWVVVGTVPDDGGQYPTLA
ncbi:sialidase family protein, partial [Salmonella enterica subsp. enterica serovar Minnesota]|uniref:hypothetical protein n=1 Tax=Salmonella enterica TaxID=28901 RepID=UPI003D26769F